MSYDKNSWRDRILLWLMTAGMLGFIVLLTIFFWTWWGLPWPPWDESQWPK